MSLFSFAASCFSLMAALRPAGPPPTIQTSTSSDSRSMVRGSNSALLVAERAKVRACEGKRIRGGNRQGRLERRLK